MGWTRFPAFVIGLQLWLATFSLDVFAQTWVSGQDAGTLGVIESLAQRHIRPVPLDPQSKFQGLYEQVAKLAPSLVEADPGETYHLLMVDDMSPQAFLLQTPKTKVLIVPTGIFKDIQNDDELAYKLASSLEHEYPVQEYFRTWDEFANWGVAASHESADLLWTKRAMNHGAVLDLVKKAGYDPTAAYEYLSRKAKGHVHPAYHSISLKLLSESKERRDIIGLGLTHEMRLQGKKIENRFKDRPRKHQIQKLSETLWENEGSLKAELRKLVQTSQAGVAKAYDEIRKGKIGKYADFYRKDFEKQWERIDTRLQALNPPDPDLARRFKLDLHQKLLTDYAAAAHEFLAQHTPTDFKELQAIFELNSPWVDLDEGLMIFDYRESVVSHNKTLPKLRKQAETDKRAKGELKRWEDYAADTEEDYRNAKAHYDAEADFEKRIDQYAKAEKKDVFQKLRPADFGIHPKGLRQPLQNLEDLRSELLKKHSSLLVGANLPIHYDERQLPSLLRDFVRFNPDPKDWKPLIEAYVNSVKASFARGKNIWELVGEFQTLVGPYRHEGTTIFQFWREYWKKEPAEAEKLYQEFLEAVRPHLDDSRHLNTFVKELLDQRTSDSVKDRLKKMPGLFVDHPDLVKMVGEKQASGIQKLQKWSASDLTLRNLDDEMRFIEAGADRFASLYPNAKLPQDEVGRLFEHLSQLLAEKEFEGGSFTLRQSRAAIASKYPDLFFSALSAEAKKELLTDLESLAQSPVRKALGPEWFSYRDFSVLFSNKRDTQRIAKILASLDSQTAHINGFGSKTEKLMTRVMAELAHSPDADLAVALRILRASSSNPAFRETFSRALQQKYQKAGSLDAFIESLSRSVSNFGDARDVYYQFIQSIEPHDPDKLADFYLTYRESLNRHFGREAGYKVDEKRIRAILSQPEFIQKADATRLTRFLELYQGELRDKSTFDKVFESIVAKGGLKQASVQQTLNAHPDWVQKLTYTENRKKLALLQIENKFPQLGFKRGLAPDSIRPEWGDLQSFLKLQFGEQKQGMPEVIEAVSQKLGSTRAESRLLQRLMPEKLDAYRGAQALRNDGIHGALTMSGLKTQEERMRVLDYLLSRDSPLPYIKSLDDKHDGPAHWEETVERSDKMKLAPVARRRLHESDVGVQTAYMQTLLDEAEGLLSNDAGRELLYRRILGNRLEDRLVRPIFETYLSSLTIGEQKTILSKILVSQIGSTGSVSLKTILESMGPLGIKTGQFLRTSGAVSPEVRKTLDDFLDQAMAPYREEIYQRMENLLGKTLVGHQAPIVSIEELMGSGSINFVVRAQVKNPHTGKVEDVVFKVLRENVQGQVANEDLVWKKAIPQLIDSKDAEVRRFGKLIDQGRRQAMKTLGEEGVEFDHRIERGLTEEARRVYRNPVPRSASGYTTEVLEPVHWLQKKLDGMGEVASQISVYPTIEFTRLGDIEDPKLRAQLAQQIHEAELTAIFDKKAFDPEGSPGNWVIDTQNKKLIRIDYPKFAALKNPEELEAFKRTLAALVRPAPDRRMVEALTQELANVFEMPAKAPADLKTAILEVVSKKDFPDWRAPHERLMFLQDQLERRYLHAGVEDFSLVFNETSGAVLESLGRIQIYSEFSSPRELGQSLLRKIGVSPAQLGGLMVKQKALSAIECFRSGLTGFIFKRK